MILKQLSTMPSWLSHPSSDLAQTMSHISATLSHLGRLPAEAWTSIVGFFDRIRDAIVAGFHNVVHVTWYSLRILAYTLISLVAMGVILLVVKCVGPVVYRLLVRAYQRKRQARIDREWEEQLRERYKAEQRAQAERNERLRRENEERERQQRSERERQERHRAHQKKEQEARERERKVEEEQKRRREEMKANFEREQIRKRFATWYATCLEVDKVPLTVAGVTLPYPPLGLCDACKKLAVTSRWCSHSLAEFIGQGCAVTSMDKKSTIRKLIECLHYDKWKRRGFGDGSPTMLAANELTAMLNDLHDKVKSGQGG